MSNSPIGKFWVRVVSTLTVIAFLVTNNPALALAPKSIFEEDKQHGEFYPPMVVDQPTLVPGNYGQQIDFIQTIR